MIKMHKKKKEVQKDKKNFLNSFNKIKVKLITSFAIPVILILILGFVTYSKASSAIIGNYEQSTSETIKTVSQYMYLMFQNINSKALELSVDPNLDYIMEV